MKHKNEKRGDNRWRHRLSHFIGVMGYGKRVGRRALRARRGGRERDGGGQEPSLPLSL